MKTMVFVLLAQCGSTWFMVGITWFAQIVHYPLMKCVGRDEFVGYELQNTQRTGWVVGPAILVEGLTAVAVLLRPPRGVLPFQTWVGFGLLVVIWLSTFFLQVPKHNQLTRGFDDQVQRTLVATNWIRTIAWSLRGLLALWMVMCALG
jgi:hypothetical protein